MTGVTDFGGETGTGGVGGGGDVFNSGEEPHPAVASRKKTVKTLAKIDISGQHMKQLKSV